MMSNPLNQGSKYTSRLSLGQRMWRYRYLYMMLLPAVAAMIIFHYLPLYGIQIAFKKYRAPLGIWGSPWVGMKYFIRMFQEETFMRVLGNTLWISFLKLIIAFPAGVIFALMLNELRNPLGKKIAQTISYLPHFISWVVLGGIVRSLFALNGPINDIVRILGGTPDIWIANSNAFVPIVVLTDVWKSMGWASIVYLAAITGIPDELYEAASIDGATRLQRILKITLPSILPVVSVMFILRTGNILSAGFDQIFNLYSPNVYDVGDILDTYVYRVGLGESIDFSYSTAIGLFKNIVGFILMLTVNRVSKSLNNQGV